MNSYKCILYFSIVLFSLCFCSVNIYAIDTYTGLEYKDLPDNQKQVASDIWNYIMTCQANQGYSSYLPTDESELTNIAPAISSLNETYFPYYGGIEVKYYGSTFINNKQAWLLNLNIKKIRRDYKKNKKTDKIVNKWVKKCTKKNMTKKQKSIAIAKYIAKKTKYLLNQKEAGVLVNKKKGNCVATSMLYKMMMKKAGIKSCRVVYSTKIINSTSHAWNTFTIGKKKYYSDVTFYRDTHKKKYLSVKKLPKTDFY